MAAIEVVGFWANKIIMVASAALLGAFFCHWTVDHDLMWREVVTEQALQSSLTYYRHLISAPPFYGLSLVMLGLGSLLACAIKIALDPLRSMLFDGGTMMLLLSGASVYANNIRATLQILPTLESERAIDNYLTKEALLTLASSNLIIAVTMTGVLALQGAQGFAERARK